MKGLRCFCVVVAFITLLAAPRAYAEVIEHASPKFRVTIPEDFVAVPAEARGKLLYGFRREGVNKSFLGTAVTIERLHGTINREPLDPAKISLKSDDVTQFDPTVTMSNERWKSFDVQFIRISGSVAGKPAVFHRVQVPLYAEAIQITVLGDAVDDAESAALLRELLGSCEGETNWLTDEQRARRLGEGAARLAIFGSLVAVGLFFAGRKAWRAFRD